MVWFKTPAFLFGMMTRSSKMSFIQELEACLKFAGAQAHFRILFLIIRYFEHFRYLFLFMLNIMKF